MEKCTCTAIEIQVSTRTFKREISCFTLQYMYFAKSLHVKV